MSLAPRKPFNSCGAAIVIAGTAPDGAAPAGTGVASAGDGVSAGVVRPAGTDGDGQATRQPVRRGLARPEFTVPGRRAGRELNVPGLQAGRASRHCPRGYVDLLAAGFSLQSVRLRARARGAGGIADRSPA